jgi:LPS-assembly protein
MPFRRAIPLIDTGVTLLVALVIAALVVVGAQAAPAKKDNDPVLLTADEVTSDESLGLVIATGNVELVQGGRTLRANTVTYNQKTKVVVASGNIRIFEPSGEVLFSDYAELTDDLKDAFIHRVKILLTDSTRAVANEAERSDGRFTKMNRVVYSPCSLCRENPDLPPIWQLRANKGTHDNQDKDVRYQDAWLDIMGVPVAYSPYFSHPDPSVKRRDGFLTPSAGNSSNTGFFIRNAYYFDVAPDRDATLETTLFAKQAPMIGGEWRQRYETGEMRVSGSTTYAPEYLNAATSGVQGANEIRGHLHGVGRFEINDAWRYGADINMASDPNFLRQYYSFRDTLLKNRAYLEGFYGRDYASVNAYRYQYLLRGLKENSPVVFPMAEYSALGEPNSMLGGRWSMDTGVLGLTRGVGTDMTRLSVMPGWQREFTSGTGVVTTVNAAVRADGYEFGDFQRSDRPAGDLTRGTEGRLFPVSQVTTRYPLVRTGENSQQVIEPIAAVTLAPRVSNRNRFPNEDARDVELDDTSLFRFNRFVGYDRLEGGQRLTYGVRSGIFGFNQGNASVFLGQDYRMSSDRPYAAGTGLGNDLSDYVGRLEVSPASWLYLNYGFRYDRDALRPNQETLNAAAGVPLLTVSSSYLYDRYYENQDSGVIESQEFATFGVSSNFTKHWSASVAHTQGIEPTPGPRTTGIAFTYGDECLIFQTLATLDHTTPAGMPPSETVFFRLVLRNVGEFLSPSFAPTSFGSGTSATR